MSDGEIRIHPAAEAFPMMDEEQFQAFKADIEKQGLLEPIVVWGPGNLVVDGRNRLRAMNELGWDIDPEIHLGRLDDNSDPFEFVISANIHRRHLSTSQRAMIAATLAKLKPGDASSQRGDADDDRQNCLSQTEAAEHLNVSDRAVRQAKSVQDKCSEPVQEMVKQGSVSVSAAEKLAKAVPDKGEQAQIAEQGPEAVKKASAAARPSPKPPETKPTPVDPPERGGGNSVKRLIEAYDDGDAFFKQALSDCPGLSDSYLDGIAFYRRLMHEADDVGRAAINAHLMDLNE